MKDEIGYSEADFCVCQAGMFIARLQDDIHNEGNRHPITIELPHLDANKILN
ncbi:MAG TPA: hypothetical protein VIM41_07430 [Gammaproteobacteria bacterium]